MAKDLTAKQRVSRIPLDYHTRSDGIRRNRNRITLAALAVAIGFVSAMAFFREWHTLGASPGPVARVHATWEQRCSDCHEPFSPINDDSRQTMKVVGGDSTTAPVSTSAEFKCQTCHEPAMHHPHQIATEEGSCTNCHHEHRGREASLTELEDRTCTRCHSQIDKHFAKYPFTAKAQSRNVNSFTHDHPEFRSLMKSDPTKLSFNHKRHLSPGLRFPDENPKLAWTVSKVAADDRARYRRSEGNGGLPDDQIEVELRCSDCHVSSADKAIGRGGPADAARDLKNLPRNQSPLATGAYMSPVKYEDHCQACHPLGYDSAGKTAVPHRLEKEGLRQLLEGRFWEQQVGAQPDQKPLRSRIRPFPGQAPGRLGREAEATVAGQVRDAEAHLRGVACKKCHDMHETAEPDALVSVEPVNMPAIWLQSADFNHMAHRGVKNGCRECHSRAYPDSANPSTRTSDLLIEGLANCRECHAPVVASRETDFGEALTGNTSTHQTGGADYRCVECHRYHRSDLSSGGAAIHAPGATGSGATGSGAAASGAISSGAIEPLKPPSQEGNRARD